MAVPSPPIETGGLPPFVGPAWLADRLDEVVLADVRWALDGSEGPQTYRERHLPGAVYVDLDTVLADEPSAHAGRHPLPSPRRFAADLGALGIGDEDVVVVYDQGSGAIAARLAWMLRAIGQPAAVLDGGLAAWQGPTVAGSEVRVPVRRSIVPWPSSRVTGTQELAARLGDGDLVVLDARDADRYAGEHEPIDARAGHVPGACNVPFLTNLADGRLRPIDALHAAYDRHGVFDASEVIAYCGSGVTACLDLLVLEHLGVIAELYAGSWSAWAADHELPLATGRETAHREPDSD